MILGSRESFLICNYAYIADNWTVKHLNHVLNLTWAARAKWYHIGLGLELTPGDLDSIRSSHDDVDTRYTETIKKWLIRGKNTDCKSLSDALRQPTVDHRQLADSVYNIDVKALPSLTRGSEESFPHLELKDMNQQERTKLMIKLSDDAEKINVHFSRFITYIIESFEKRNLSPRTLARRIIQYNTSMLDTCSDQLMNAKFIDDIVIELRKRRYITLFNHHLLEYVVQNIGEGNEKKELESFRKQFKEYCERSVCEVPKDLFDDVPNNRVKFAVKISKHALKDSFPTTATSESQSTCMTDRVVERSSQKLGLTINDTLTTLGKLAKVLGLECDTLCLAGAIPGCTKIIISIPKSVAENTFPKIESNSDVAQLESSGICIVCGPPGRPKAVQITSTSVKLTWTRPEYQIKNIKKYLIFMKSASHAKSEWESVQTIGQEETITVTDLHQRGCTFVFKVCAISDSGEGVESEESEMVALAGMQSMLLGYICMHVYSPVASTGTG